MKYLKIPKEAKIDCSGCASECCKSGGIYLTPKDDHSKYSRIPVPKVSPFDGSYPSWKIPDNADGSCHYLGPDGCMIYEDRPAMCRAFSCVAYVALGGAEIGSKVWEEGTQRA